MAATITDILILMLLAGSIAYGIVISRKVQVLMAILKDLEPLVSEFSNAVDKSEASVSLMRENLESPSSDPGADVADHGDTTFGRNLAFTSRRPQQARMSGVQVVRNKKDMVRMFFEKTRSESRA